MLLPFEYTMPTKIIYGEGTIAQAGEGIKNLAGQKPLLVTDQGVRALTFFESLKDSLAGADLAYEVYDTVSRDPDLKEVDELVGMAMEKGCDSVVALGGGSVLCAAKGLAVTAPSGTSSRDLVGIDMVKEHPLPIVAIPTTAGSGSEVSDVTVLSDRESKRIVTIISHHCFPGLTILDPAVLADLPPRQAAISGVDALAHGLESLMTVRPNPISEAIAVQACATMIKELPQAALTGEMEPKGRCLIASAMTNMACGATGINFGHAMILPLTAHLDMPHGLAAGLLMPHVTAYNLPASRKRLIPLMQALGYEADAEPDLIVDELKALIKNLGFGDFELPEVDEATLKMMAEEVANSPITDFNVRKVEQDHVLNIYKAIFSKTLKE
jgi:alcohol dehydrogenase class IV